MPRIAGSTSTISFCANCCCVSKWVRAAWRAKAKVTTTAASNIRKEKATAIRVRSDKLQQPGHTTFYISLAAAGGGKKTRGRFYKTRPHPKKKKGGPPRL